jgi:protein-S-isoprenylcysteine O-methyltransferase Ste14
MERQEMGLVLNLLVQTIVWFGLMGAIIFFAAGTMDYPGGWLLLGEMVAISVVLGVHMMRVDPGLLSERLKPPVQKDQPFADKLVLIPVLVLMFGGMGSMAADAARWHWSGMAPSVQWAGCGLLLAAFLFMYWTMPTNSFAAPVVKILKIQRDRGQTVITTGPYAIVRHPLYLGALFYIAGTSLVLGAASWTA